MTPQPDLVATILHASMVRNNGTEVVFSKRLKVAQSSIACSQVMAELGAVSHGQLDQR